MSDKKTTQTGSGPKEGWTVREVPVNNPNVWKRSAAEEFKDRPEFPNLKNQPAPKR